MNTSSAANLKNHPLFIDFSQEEYSFIREHSQTKHFRAGETIMSQGSYGDELYLLQKGRVLVYVTLPGDTQKLATKLDSGQIFGEVTFLTQTPITASIVAENDCTCLSFSREILNTLHFSHPVTAYKFETNIIRQTREKIINQILLLISLLGKIAGQADISSQHALRLFNHKAQCKKLPNANLDFNYLKQIHFFSALQEKDFLFLLSFMSFRQYDRGYPFQFLNSVHSRLCIPYSGAVMMFIKQDEVLNKSIAVSGIGEIFLENPTSLFPEFQQYVAYLTSERSTILELDFDAYYKIRDLNPGLFFHISREINHHIARLVYIVNRQFVRINCEYENLIG
ncbi:Cyclic nucleotide-binding domain-containing protein [Legionella micdadei]|nr:cyclic nucleotide-binding domain-containing protein [Legionella micdadei]KTD26472.1 sulfate transporter [Legionella micdadei]SCY24266.1 Cyclic nucleotide-binding domain-containing protein [Legionella micdadei]